MKNKEAQDKKEEEEEEEEKEEATTAPPLVVPVSIELNCSFLCMFLMMALLLLSETSTKGFIMIPSPSHPPPHSHLSTLLPPFSRGTEMARLIIELVDFLINYWRMEVRKRLD